MVVTVHSAAVSSLARVLTLQKIRFQSFGFLQRRAVGPLTKWFLNCSTRSLAGGAIHDIRYSVAIITIMIVIVVIRGDHLHDGARCLIEEQLAWFFVLPVKIEHVVQRTGDGIE